MEQVNIPDGYQQVMPYLILKDARGFLDFTQKVFGAREKFKMMREDDPSVVMHAEVTIGDSVIMFADSNDQWGVSTAGLYVYVADVDAAYQRALETGATSVMEISEQSYGRSGGVKDPFGNTWWIVTDQRK